jgi:hypothetical protein
MIILEQAKSLLDFNQKLDIGVLDRVVHLMYTEHGDTVGENEGEKFLDSPIVWQTQLCGASQKSESKTKTTNVYVCDLFVNCKAKTSRRNTEHVERPSGLMDTCRYDSGIFAKPADQILCTANTGKDNQNKVESTAKTPVRR